MKSLPLSLLALSIISIVGCGQPPTMTLQGVGFTVEALQVTKTSPGVAMNGPGSATVIAGNDKYDIQVDHGVLTINGETYGNVVSGDSVRILDGSVSINGKEMGPVTEVKSP